jgi:hypothetical protein
MPVPAALKKFINTVLSAAGFIVIPYCEVAPENAIPIAELLPPTSEAPLIYAIPEVDNDVNVPTEVKLDAVTLLPNVVEFRTLALLILYALPVGILTNSDNVQLALPLSQIIVLSVAPFKVIPR